MSTLTILGSSSRGNGYVLRCRGAILVIELGLPFSAYQKEIGGNWSSVVGAIVSHKHHDHARPDTMKHFNLRQIRVRGPQELAEYGLPLVDKTTAHFYDYAHRLVFTVKALSVPHTCDCNAYVITTADGECILFYTDCSDFRYQISGVTCILGEVNYCARKLALNEANGYNKSRPDGHMELETAVNVVSRHYSPKLREVVCLHLSDGNSDENEIITRFRGELGITPIIAQPGIVLDLTPNEPF